MREFVMRGRKGRTDKRRERKMSNSERKNTMVVGDEDENGKERRDERGVTA